MHLNERSCIYLIKAVATELVDVIDTLRRATSILDGGEQAWRSIQVARTVETCQKRACSQRTCPSCCFQLGRCVTVDCLAATACLFLLAQPWRCDLWRWCGCCWLAGWLAGCLLLVACASRGLLADGVPGVRESTDCLAPMWQLLPSVSLRGYRSLFCCCCSGVPPGSRNRLFRHVGASCCPLQLMARRWPAGLARLCGILPGFGHAIVKVG